MAQRSRRWRIGAAVFIVINIAGAVFAAVMGEPLHASVHVALTLVGAAAFLAWGPKRAQVSPHDELAEQQAAQSLDHLQQSVDAIALEVERIGEAQRFEAKLVQERVKNSPPKKDT
jgi:hypothetical protein